MFATMLRLQINNILNASNLPITRIRKKVLSAFLKSEKPLSLKEIRLLTSSIDRVTLFRTLIAFEEKNIIHSIHIDDHQKLYAVCYQECVDSEYHVHKHIHFKCDTCSEVSCVPFNDFPKINVPNYIINHVSINVSGECVNCVV